MTIPVTLNYAQVDSFPLEEFYPNTVQMIDEQVRAELSEAEYRDSEMFIETPFFIENKYGAVAGGLPSEESRKVLNLENILLFEQNQFIIHEDGAPEASVIYTSDFSLGQAKDQEDIVNELNRQWFNQNRVLIVFIFSLMISTFLFMMLLLIVFGSALFLYFTKRSDITSITTYKESINLMVNVLSLPTILSMIFGLFYFDITLMVTMQTIGLIIMLFIIYYKTQFNDDNIETENE